MIQTAARGSNLPKEGAECIQRLAQSAGKKSCQIPAAMLNIKYIYTYIYKFAIDTCLASITVPEMSSFVGGRKHYFFFLFNIVDFLFYFSLKQKRMHPSCCFFSLLSSFQSNRSTQFIFSCSLNGGICPRASTVRLTCVFLPQFNIPQRAFVFPG